MHSPSEFHSGSQYGRATRLNESRNLRVAAMTLSAAAHARLKFLTER